MTVDYVKTKVKELLANADQTQRLKLRFHLMMEVLTAISQGEPNAAELAKETLARGEQWEVN